MNKKMSRNQLMKGKKFENSIIILFSIIGLIVCIAILFPPVRQIIMDYFGKRILHRDLSITYQSWFKVLFSYAIAGICFILFFDYCTLVASGRSLVNEVKQGIKDCLSEINFRSFLKPGLFISMVYLLGILTIIRANFSYIDDIARSVGGYRGWHVWSRYVSEFSSILVHGDTNLTDISPLPQLLAVLILSLSSVLLVYVINNKKITALKLLASIPLGLSPYFLECLSFKFDAPYMALSILASIVPFLFIASKKAFFFCSVLSLLIMCMTYQAASGIYLLMVIMLSFQEWSKQKKSNKEILSFMGIAAFAFGFTMLFFRFFLVKPADFYSATYYNYASTTTFPILQIIPGALNNIKNYALVINQDLGIIWKGGILLLFFFFIIQSMHHSAQKKFYSFFVSILVIGFSFVASYGIYSFLAIPFFRPRALFGFGIFLAILCISVVSDYKKIATAAVLALNWCLFVFAFSYGNALADQARYTDFRLNILLSDISSLYPNWNREEMTIQLKNSIDFAPSIKNISKHNPIIERLVPKRLEKETNWDNYYFDPAHFEKDGDISNKYDTDTDSLDLPVVLDSYYHTIQSDGSRILITLKH